MSWYMRLLETRPYLTKSVTSAALWWLGDAIQQGIQHRSRLETFKAKGAYELGNEKHVTEPPNYWKQFDWPRSARFAAIGGAVVGPLFHNWFFVLDRISPGNSAKAVLTKMAIDQVTMAPAFTVGFFAIMGALEGRDSAVIKQRITDYTLPTLIDNYKLWPAAQLLNFYVIPIRARVLWLNMTGLVWNTYLSSVNQKEKKAEVVVVAAAPALSASTPAATATAVVTKSEKKQ